MKKLSNLWFTLIELIIVITILSILSTIAFISFWNYTAMTRDEVRVSNLKMIEKALNLNEVEKESYPLPAEASEPQEIEWIEWVKWRKWKFWNEQYLAVNKMEKLPLDPSTNEAYNYFLSEDGNYYMLESTREVNGNKIIVTNFINPNLASNTNISSSWQWAENTPDTWWWSSNSPWSWDWNENDSWDWNINNPDNNLSIPSTAMLYWNTEQITSCNRDSWGRFKVNNWVIFDNMTWLYWEENPSPTKTSLNQAKNKCANLTLWWYSDWKLPSITELRSIVNYSCSNPASYDWFNLSFDYYGSSTHYPALGYIWIIHFWTGEEKWYYGDSKFFICVR